MHNTLVTIFPMRSDVKDSAPSEGDSFRSSNWMVPETYSAAIDMEIFCVYVFFSYTMATTSALIALTITFRAASILSSSSSTLVTLSVALALSWNIPN